MSTGFKASQRRAEASEELSRIFAGFLERHETGGADPETLFAAHPEHATVLRRWWRRLLDCGEVKATACAAETLPAQRFGRYRLLSELGRGAQGTVHLAEDSRLGRRVALKLLPTHRNLSAEAQQRFRREAELVSRLDHPGVCTIFEAGEEQGTAFIAMRYVDGETLAARIARAIQEGRPLPVPETVMLCAQVAVTLQAAHDRKLVHRDIKPGNIMVGRDGKPVILDFGLAQHAEDGGSITKTGDLLGTPAYMSHEQLAAHRIPIDGRTDVYSLGVVLFECLTLRRPFQAPTHAALYEQILNAPLPNARALNRDIGKDLAIVLETALARDRGLRYQTANDFAEDLRRVARGEPILARPPSPWQRVRSWTRRHPTLATTSALSLVLLVGGTAAGLALHRAQNALGQLADLESLREAIHEEEESLYPPVPALTSRFEHWLRTRAGALAARLPLHRARLAQLGRGDRQTPESRPESPVSAGQHDRIAMLRAEIESLRSQADQSNLRFRRDELLFSITRLRQEVARLEQGLTDTGAGIDDPHTRVEHQTLQQLVRDLEHFLGPTGAVARVQDRLAFAREVTRRTVDDFRVQWDEARALARGSERYRKRELPVQIGLVPLGPDPGSGLLEFAHLRSGAPPRRDAAGRLVLLPDSGIVLVLIPGGRFVMGAGKEPGSQNRDPEADVDEAPAGEIELDWFLLGKHELTRGQWRRLGGETLDPRELPAGADLDPLAHITWHSAERVLRREGLELPTEAQWESGMRAGSRTRFFVGDDPRALRPHVHGRLLPADAFPDEASAVDSHAPNRFGLHHMAGNILEWCRDSYFAAGPLGFAHSPGDGERMLADTGRRVVRGGSFRSPNVAGFRSAWRGFRSPGEHRHDLGLRVARRVDPDRGR